VQRAAVGLDAYRGPVLLSAPSTDTVRLRCASVLKPLLCWAAATLPAYRDNFAQWAALAEPAVRISANEPTVSLWERCGADGLLRALATRTGRDWPLEPGGARSFGRVLIRADDVAWGYGALAAAAAAGDIVARRLLDWMRSVPDGQTFGARSAVATAAAVPPATIAVKSGWFCDADETALRTHTVTVLSAPTPSLVTAVLTAVRPDPVDRARYAEAYAAGEDVIGMHQRYAGDLIATNTEYLVRDALG
jgi:hypothetical protein